MNKAAPERTDHATTVHGEVEYKTVECASCGNTVPKQQAKRFVIGTTKNIEHWGMIGKRDYSFETADYQEGWACEYCRNDGVINFPLKSIRDPTVLKLAGTVAAFAFTFGLIVGGLF
jgi:hypothetical protein